MNSVQCTVWGYVPGHSQLFVRVNQTQSGFSGEAYYLIFETVLYFAGPMTWGGADLRVGTADESEQIMALLRQGGLQVPSHMQESFMKKYKLFVLDSPDLHVRVFAEKVYRTTDDPRTLNEKNKTLSEVIDITPPSPFD